ncbi:bifunctional glutamate N-acetyltransferase/amino-acid acetyltransferase ArgJ [Candidatus Poribacteria bacterium]|nr:bifunctional glutamate N-acetyltransferase/amino-acid acetyltransferase ArgJ [Candidatus Poribacteria bacterium]
MKQTDGGITAVPGIRAAGVECGIKTPYYKEKRDLALIVCDKPSPTAGTFTTNKAKAAPVIISQEHIKNGKAQAIVANSGNPNACTGEQGLKDAIRMAQLTAELLNISPELVLIGSTGRIGVPMPMEKVEAGIKKAFNKLSYDGGNQAAHAIMTTDKFPKEIAVEFQLNEKKCRIGGIVKGAGMIEPNMATMLCFLATDVNIDQPLLQSALKASVDKSFNMISIDGDMSTNDTVIIMANGMAENEVINSKDKSYKKFCEALDFVTLKLAKMIVKDGEGATKFVEIRIKGAKTNQDASKAAHALARSPLVKTSFFGEDDNWGRYMSTLGASGIEMDGTATNIWLDDLKIVENSITTGYDKANAKDIIKKSEFTITFDLKAGNAKATLWTCDMSYDYIKCNI